MTTKTIGIGVVEFHLVSTSYIPAIQLYISFETRITYILKFLHPFGVTHELNSAFESDVSAFGQFSDEHSRHSIYQVDKNVDGHCTNTL
jgi:hypothetical protein